MPKEYIERGKLLEILKNRKTQYPMETWQKCGFEGGWRDAVDEIEGDVKSIPAADVAPVVRCKDCKYLASNGDVLYCRNRRGLTIIQNANNYCNYGKVNQMIKLDDTPNQEKAELKPCPFCGRKAEIHKELIKFLPEAQYGYRVFCSSLYCAVSPYTELYIKLESAVETWNRRAENG